MALNSVSTIKVLDLLCEGPIGGIIGGAKGIYLNETPIQNADGTYNYQESDWAWSAKIGGSNQAKPSFFNDGVSQIVEVNQEIGENYSEVLDANNEVVSRDYGPGIVIRQITEPQISNVQLLFTVPRLFSVAQESLAKGQFFGGTIRIRIFVQAKGSGAPYVLAQDKTINGISTNSYQFLTGLINLPSFGRAPWNIKVEKLDLGEEHFEVKYTSFEDISQKTSLANGRGNQIIWSAITEIVQQSVNYNYSAYSELSLSTKSFALSLIHI